MIIDRETAIPVRMCIPIEFKPRGGGFYFLQSLEEYLRKKEWLITREIKGAYDLLFTNHWMTPKRDILKAFRYNPQVRIIQRIDGAAQDYGRDPEVDLRQNEVNQLVDLTIFQSEYCRFSTRKKFHVISQDGPVIHNPVDINIFRPNGTRLWFPRKYQIACVTWSTNPMKGAANVFTVAKLNPTIDFVLCGNYPDAPDLPNIHNLGVLGREDLASALRSCHVLLTFSRNEACPNHVLEALACGLPVLYDGSGAMAEVIGDCGLPVTIENFSYQFQEIISMIKVRSSNARNRAIQLFSPKVILPRYFLAFQDALSRPPRVPIFKRKLMAWITHPSYRFMA